MPSLEREEVDVTASLRNILDNYPAGKATLREILQNTDDAGAKTQGPAIIATNDGYFKDKDWKAIKTILNSSKRQDENSAGKYGLGFRACYHVTDTPHILSGDKLLILDPHARVEKFQGGFGLKTKRVLNEENEIEREVYKDHFTPFSAVLKPDDEIYSGTAIRLPLRLPGSQSKLESAPTRVEDARRMFSDFIAKELPEAMLFLKNITEIKLMEIDTNSVETVLATATLEKADVVAPQWSGDRGKLQETSHHRLTITFQIGSGLPFTRGWIITQFTEKHETVSGHMARRLQRSQNDVEVDMAKGKLFPHVALALPIPQDNATATPGLHGRLFTLLPVPIVTNFPVHINAVFALLPNRQSLQNTMDLEAGSRAEFLVEWNRVIFFEFVPKAWAALLDHLVTLSSANSSVPPSSIINVLDAWPGPVASQDGDPGYWYPVPSRLLEEAADRVVWPLHGKKSQFSALGDILVGEKGESVAPLASLEACSVPLVVVPQRVYNLIKTSVFKKTILSPETAYSQLKKNSHKLSDLDALPRKLICDYLVSANDIRLILDLPIIPQGDNEHTSITSHGEHIMANESETSIFGDVDQNLLTGKCMSNATQQLLLGDPAGRVRLVSPADVVRYLESQVRTFDGMARADHPISARRTTFEWFIRFWKWLDEWEKLSELINDSAAWGRIRNAHALPICLSGERFDLRHVAKSAIRPAGLDAEVVAALIALEIPMLDTSMSEGKAVQQVSKDHSDVVFILQSLPKKKSPTLALLNQESRRTLHDFFTQQLSAYLRSAPQESRPTLREFFTQQLFTYRRPAPKTLERATLSAELRSTLRTLPIFPIFNPGSRDNNITFDVAPEGACFVDDSVGVIPNIRGTVFVSYDQGKTLHTALGEQDILGEIVILQKAIGPDEWSQQDSVPGLVSALVDRLINRLNELGAPTREIIAELPIVEVDGRAGRRSPKEVIDPSSELVGLYDVEDGVLPIGQFAEGAGSYISLLRTYKMIRTTLTPSAIAERVARISDQSRPMKDRAEKSLHLLKLLESYTRPDEPILTPDIVEILVRAAWLPVGDAFHRPSECWDSRSKDVLLCDLVFPRIQFSVTSGHLRDCFGWTRVPFTTLKAQLFKVLEVDPKSSNTPQTNDLDRIEAVLRELASEFKAGRLLREDIGSLVAALGDAAWVPTASRSRCAARQAMLEQIDLGMKYHSVIPSLLRSTGMEELLKQMEIPRRPTKASLFSTLQEISTELSAPGVAVDTRDGLVRTSILILEELKRTIGGSESEFQKILVPTDACQLAPAPEVLFNDLGGDRTSPPPGLNFAHSQVSQSLASILGLRWLSEEEFSQDGDGIESFHMGEDLPVGIKGVLQDYDIDLSGNDWVAKADNAGAHSVTFLVDEASFDGRGVIAGLNSFQSGPALVVHNDGKFTDEDFRRLVNIGQGGKSGRTELTSRFGLGALSFYHFSEFPWVVSGKYCLFLDPSQQFLPRDRNARRSAALVPLSLCMSRYPDQLKPLEGLFGFSSKDGDYNGTLFRFPLRTAAQATKSKLLDKYFSAGDITRQINHFYAYARQSLFFTKSLDEISALCRTARHDSIPMWSVRSSRERISNDAQNQVLASKLSLVLKASDANEISEDWLITKSEGAMEEFPENLRPVFSRHRLPTAPTCGLALNLSAQSSIPNSRLFSTLPLTVSTSLPVHIHATWILAQDRRSIRYDAADAASHRPLDSRYNEYLLENAIVSLYLKTLALALLHCPRLVHQFWPRRTYDDLTRAVVTQIHKRIVSTQETILLSARNQPISPSKAIIHRSNKTPMVVQRVLTKLQISNYVPDPYFNTSFWEATGSLRFDSAKEVSRILRDNATAVKELWSDVNSNSSSFTPTDVMSILEYLESEGESLDGIPLLLRGDRQIVDFQSSGHRKIFASDRSELSDLFGSSTIVSLDLSDDEALSLVNPKLNVRQLDPQGMRDLLAHHTNPIAPASLKAINNADRDWYSKLLKFLTSPECPVQLEDLDDLPLLPAVNRDLVVSLRYANSGKIWWRYPYEDQVLSTILHQLDVTAVDILPEGFQRAEVPDLARILRLFGQLGLSSAQVLQKVTPEEWDAFVHWIKLWIHGPHIEKLSASDFQILMELPLFSGRQGMNHLPFVSGSQVLMLPESVPLNVLARYLPPETVFAEYSPDLAAILQKGHNTKNLSFADLLNRLRLPNQLSQDEDASFSALLDLIAASHHGSYHNQLIPDGNRVLRCPSELFDHRIELFSMAFEGRGERFVHPSFCHLIDGLVGLGVQRDVTSQILLRCIEEVDHDAVQGPEPVYRARWFWDYINTAPPQLRQIPFDSIRRLRFLPRHTQRHPSDPDFDGYARRFPNVVSPNDLCAPGHDLVVWTQRARFVAFPSPHLTAVYPLIGKPTMIDVLKHLVYLIADVSPNRPQSYILLDDIEKVYDWLMRNAEGQLKSLAKHRLWLNVDSAQDEWTWCAADELVFGLAYDTGGCFMVRNFLLPYRTLLLGAGAHEYRVASLPTLTSSATKTPHPEIISSGWNKLRKTGQLFDICFKVQGQEIPAHRGMLAATIPHFETAFAGSFRESIVSADDTELPVYRLPEEDTDSAFAIQSVIDYVYTGTFSRPTFSNPNEADAALEDLLDLMSLSKLWEILELTNEAVQAIVDLELIRFDNCDGVLKHAEACQMTPLITLCQRTKEQNQWK
ncbi:hypothetical protein FRC04_010535 [Tulasnella sp. 424]|nr:hypothetical protein FRC04_010535 [Tulasnella sp. 424]